MSRVKNRLWNTSVPESTKPLQINVTSEYASKKPSTTNRTSRQPQRTQHVISIGIQGLMRSFTGQQTFLCSWEENLDSTICVYETMETSSDVTEEERLKAVSVMLSGDPLLYHTSHAKQLKLYEEATNLLWQFHISADKRLRILTK